MTFIQGPHSSAAILLLHIITRITICNISLSVTGEPVIVLSLDLPVRVNCVEALESARESPRLDNQLAVSVTEVPIIKRSLT